MDWAACKLLLVDLTDRALLWVDNATEEVLLEIPYPPRMTAADLLIGADPGQIYLPLWDGGRCHLFAADLAARSLRRLPADLPHAVQFALDAARGRMIFADIDGTLYALDLARLEARPLARPEGALCVGIAAGPEKIYTAWETSDGGVAAFFDAQGRLLEEHSLPGIPTNIRLHGDRALIPFTSDDGGAEGLTILSPDGAANVIIQSERHSVGLRAYPCNVAVDRNTAYVVNEDSGSITLIDLSSQAVSGQICVGRSISNLCLIAGDRLAIASSNMFADLSLIDLVNRRLVSVTGTGHEIFAAFALWPSIQ